MNKEISFIHDMDGWRKLAELFKTFHRLGFRTNIEISAGYSGLANFTSHDLYDHFTWNLY